MTSTGMATSLARSWRTACQAPVNFPWKTLGSLSFSELSNAVSHGGQRLSEEEMNAIFVVGDIDQNGEIDLEEFKRMMMPSASDVVSKFRPVHKTTKDVQAAFKRFDADGDGAIDKKEMTQA